MSRADRAIEFAVGRGSVRLWERLLEDCHYDPQTKCRLWTGYRDRGGYGRITIKGREGWSTVAVHRLAYALMYGMRRLPLARRKPSRFDLVLAHTCRYPACFNPAHLTVLTYSQAYRRGFAAKGYEDFEQRRDHGKERTAEGAAAAP